MNKKCGAIVVVLFLIILSGAYKFIIQGSTLKDTDGRTAIYLTAGEKSLILEEMRAFLISVQQITKGISENNMDIVAEYARKSGKAAQGEVPGTLMGKLPLTFKKLGFDTHTKFDQLALDAKSLADGDYALKQLTKLMQNCVNCHTIYRLKVGTK